MIKVFASAHLMLMSQQDSLINFLKERLPSMNEAKNYTSFLKEDFALYIRKREKEVSESRLKCDKLCIKSLDCFLTSNSADDIDAETMNEFISSNYKSNRLGTKNLAISSIRTCIKYLNALKGTHYFVPDYVTCDKSYVPHYFDQEEKNIIYTVVDNYIPGPRCPFPWLKVEIPMLVRILAGCGTRIQEVLSLKMEDYDVANGVIIIKTAKHNKQRRVPLSESLSNILKSYCQAMGIIGTTSEYLFPRRNRKEHLMVRDISGERFRKILIELNIRKPDELSRFERGVCMYNFRHTFAIDSFRKLNNMGISVNDLYAYLSIYLGHNSLMETQRYLKFCSELFPEDLDRFFDEADKLAPAEDKWAKWDL